MAQFLRLRDCTKCKRKIDFFDFLSEDELMKINETRYEVRFNRSENLFKQGTSFSTRFLLLYPSINTLTDPYCLYNQWPGEGIY